MDMDFNGLYDRKNMVYKIRVIRYRYFALKNCLNGN